jgi:hypothetical protein
MQQQKQNAYATPALPTRERALYVAAAHAYADAFRSTFVDPSTARRAFRRAAEWDERRALAALLLHPDDYGPRCARRFASAVRDPAYVYWTMRERRPRAFLMRIVDLLYAEAGRRAHLERITQTRKSAETYGHRAGTQQDQRVHDRSVARGAVEHSAAVYARPASACRVILRVIRRHGADRARALLEARPEFFGALRIVKHPRGIWPLLLVFDSTTEAKRAVEGFLNSFDATVRMRRDRMKAGHVQRTAALAAFYHASLQHLTTTEPPSGALAEAGRLLAILCRRRDVDEPPKGKGPPPIYKQIAAMLPDPMAELIDEAFKLAKKESGDSPEWDRGRDGYGRELRRSLGLELDFVSRGSDRGRERSRGGGMER